MSDDGRPVEAEELYSEAEFLELDVEASPHTLMIWLRSILPILMGIIGTASLMVGLSYAAGPHIVAVDCVGYPTIICTLDPGYVNAVIAFIIGAPCLAFALAPDRVKSALAKMAR